MRQWVYDCWNSVMNYERNPLRHIPDLHARHMIMQVLAWMWCIVFSFYIGSFFVFGVSAIAHVALLGAIAITVGTFEAGKRGINPFDLKKGYHSYPRARQNMWINGKKVKYCSCNITFNIFFRFKIIGTIFGKLVYIRTWYTVYFIVKTIPSFS